MTKEPIEKIRELHLKLALEHGYEKTYCPSEVARKLDVDNWQKQMQNVREVADDMVRDKVLEVLQKRVVLDKNPSQAKGPIRLRLKRP